MTTWLLLAVLALLVASALFVAAEFSLVAARRTNIEPRALTSARARATIAAMEEVSVMMACAQLGITVCALLLGALGEPAVAHLIEPVLAGWGLPPSITTPLSLVLALAIVVAAHVAFGEMVPKNIALAAPESVAMALAPGLRALARALGPVVRGLNHAANGMIRLTGLTPAHEVASTFTREEVAALVAQSAKEGLIDPEDERLIGSALTFAEATVADALISDDRVLALGPEPTAAQVESACARSGFSRFPVRSEDGDFAGFVHVRDVLTVSDPDRDRPIPLQMIRAMPIISTATTLRNAMDVMRERGVHLARVHDVANPGRPVGVVMLEDIIELLVGEIGDATTRLA